MQVSGSPACDDLGTPVPVPAEVTRVVSLVPSLTESLAATAPGLLVGATDWCTQPPDLAVRRVRGTKNPDLDAILDLRPDVVLTNEEENRLPDLDALRAAGLAIWVTAPRSVPEALASLDRMLTVACRLGRPAWLDEAVAARDSVSEGTRETTLVTSAGTGTGVPRSSHAGDPETCMSLVTAVDGDQVCRQRLDLRGIA